MTFQQLRTICNFSLEYNAKPLCTRPLGECLEATIQFSTRGKTKMLVQPTGEYQLRPHRE